MHQDRPYFPFKNDSMVAAFIHLDDSDLGNGGLSIVPGSHRLGQLPTRASSGHHWVSQSEFPIAAGVEVKAKAGDVAFFPYLTVHGSYPNTSRQPRRMVLVQVYDPRDKMLEHIHLENGLGFLLHGSAFTGRR